jgi:hypothetical protein
MANGITPFTPLRTKLSCYLYSLTVPNVERRVRRHAYDCSVTGLQANLAWTEGSGRQNLIGCSDLGSGRVSLHVRDLDVRVRLTDAAAGPVNAWGVMRILMQDRHSGRRRPLTRDGQGLQNR